VGKRVSAATQTIFAGLASVEELAGIVVLCSDKTGALTQKSLEPGRRGEHLFAERLCLFRYTGLSLFPP
jgi:hypothetical protein